jgi:hypothetical protein
MDLLVKYQRMRALGSWQYHESIKSMIIRSMLKDFSTKFLSKSMHLLYENDESMNNINNRGLFMIFQYPCT